MRGQKICGIIQPRFSIRLNIIEACQKRYQPRECQHNRAIPQRSHNNPAVLRGIRENRPKSRSFLLAMFQFRWHLLQYPLLTFAHANANLIAVKIILMHVK